VLLARGKLTLDLELGRRTRPLGPLELEIAAPRETVFDVISAPYLGRTPKALATKLRVLERGEDMVLAEHFTDTGRFVTSTVETVRFERPSHVRFRLVRGPVPLVVEQFALVEEGDGTKLEYTGELSTDLWALGEWWGARVAAKWEAAVRSSLDGIKTEAERRAA
jgi:Polyketide cyclase / dehydrase and lipid transport